jgi:penicillin amidase
MKSRRIDLRKWSVVVVGFLLVLAAALYAALAASLPRRSGEARLATLNAPVTIELDTHAIPRIRARAFEDALRAQGFMHAQERYFQMDVLRRFIAGELAALVGEAALPVDRAQRFFQYRNRATALAASLPAEQRAWLSAYTEGVNAGLADLRARPPEYWVVRARPKPWTVEDTLLVLFSYTSLSLNHTYELGHGVMHAVLAPEVYEFLIPFTSRFDRPLVRDSVDPTGGYQPLPVPSAATFDSTVVPTGPPASWIEVDPPLCPRVESVGRDRRAQRARWRNSRERPAFADQAPHLFLSVRALLGRRRSTRRQHPGAARDRGRRERRAGLGRDEQHGRSERLDHDRDRSPGSEPLHDA